MLHHRRAALGAVLAFVGLAACGGSDEPPATCGTFAACGGAIEGTWAVEKTCATPTMTIPTGICGDAVVDFSMAQGAGQVTFAKDGSYTGGLGLTGTAKLMLPAACLSISGQMLTCPQLSLAIALAQTQNAQLAALGTFACSGTTTCNCVATLPAMPPTSTGTYVTANSTLTLTAQGQQPQALPYCVKGNRLEAALPLPTAVTGANASSQSYVILHKK
jgi:hypothetical protein